MYLAPLNILFFFTLTLGTFLALSSSSWFNAWAGLELNLLSFIPLLISSKSRYSSEAALKYFLIQALGSTLIIFSSALLLFSPTLFSISMASALLLKLGATPFHFWFTQIMESLMWPQAIIMMTIQKMAPIFLLAALKMSYNITWMLLLSSSLSAVVGALGGMNQTSLRKIMAFSSVNHMAWMLAASVISEVTLLLYFSLYCFISASVALMFSLQQSFHFSHIINQTTHFPAMKILIFSALLSLGGLPPFMGFFPKWAVIQNLLNMNLYLLLGVLLLSSLITLYYYIRIMFSSLVILTPKLSLSPTNKKPLLIFYPAITAFNLLGLMVPCCFLMF
uniref:NADH-ubiquinone oxidoreductase chain 2 n=1 Tax=Munidopsis verrilli TaxID=2652437 RepID=A0A5J6UPP4_9EUCA|nr:NADH dehydrogenase subunit 2 [Munidopsis verrilli]